MKPLIALVLAVIVGGCCSWEDISRPDVESAHLYIASKWSDECNCPKSLYVKHPAEHPERYLYVEDHLTGPCQYSLRVAYASDTGRTYRWDEIPDAFSPCK